MQKIGDHSVKIILNDEEYEKMNEIAKRHQLAHAQVVRNLYLVGAELYDDLQISGAVKAVELYKKGVMWLSKIRSSKQLRLI